MADTDKTGTPSNDRPESAVVQVADPAENARNQRATKAGSLDGFTLDEFSVSALREFFQLLDNWDRAGDQNDD